MYKYTLFAVAVFWTTPLFADSHEHTIDIVSPVANSCVNNGNEVYTGGLIGGQAQAQRRDVPLEFTVHSPDGETVMVSFLTEWTEAGFDGNPVPRNEMYQIMMAFPEGEDTVTTDSYPIPGFFIGDGTDVRVTIRSEHPSAQLAEAEVVFDLDREAPTVQMTPEQIAGAQDQCSADPPPFQYALEDNRTAVDDITSSIRTERDGCIVRRIITVRDDCGDGNAQELELVNYSPLENNIVIGLEGYRCSIDSCVLDGEGAETFEDGARVSRPTFVPILNGPPGCVGQVENVIMRADRQVDTCPAQPPVLVGAVGNECVADNECGGDQTCTNGYCAEPNICDSDDDCRDGRYCREGGCESPCQALEGGQAIEEPGDYVARTRVTDCAGGVNSATMAVTVLQRPVANPGGNLENGDYQVAQGDPLMLDGSTSFAAPEVGGITQYAWDLNQDGFFDADSELFGADEPTVAFDTNESGTFRIRMRVTAGNGASAYVWFNVIVEDANPICDAGGPYEIAEGQALRLDGSASMRGHEADPIRAYAWDFGDGFRPQEGATLDTPLHIYGDGRAEPYVVTLTVSDPDSSTACTALVTVTDVEPQFDEIVVLNPQSVIEGETIRFEALAQAGSQSDPLTNFAWNFDVFNGQQEGPAMRTAEWQFMDNGDYDVCVTVQDEDSSIQRCLPLAVADLEPTAFFDGPNGGAQGDELTFDASNTQAGGAADQLTQLVWNWGDGSNLETIELRAGFPNQFVNSHTFAQDGTFTVTLRVIDEDSASTFQREVTITDARPIAQMDINYPTAERSIGEGVDLLFNAGNSEAGSATDPIVSYRWDFGDGSPARTVGQDEPGILHNWADEGAYEVRLTAIDVDQSENTVMRIVEVTNVAPVVALQTDDVQVAIGQNIQFATVSGALPAGAGPSVYAVVEDVPGDLPPELVRWEMGDGSVIESGSHRYSYNTLGRKTVTVTVNDGDGGVTEAEIQLTVTPAAPDIEVVEPQSVREGETLVFEFLVQAPATGPGVFDAIEVNTIEAPEGAVIGYIEEGNDVRVRFSWTPTFYDSGYHRLWMRATSAAAERLRIIDINVDDAGVPRLVAAGGTAARGVVTFYDYEQGARSVVLRSTPEIELGLGVGSLAVAEDGRHVWATVPGSNRVAAISTEGNGRLVRRVPVGRMPSGVVAGDGHIWVANQLDNSVSIIEASAMKVVSTFVLDGVTGPTDMAWLPAVDDEPARILIATHSGHLVVLDTAQARLGGIQPVLLTRQLGGILSRVVVDVDADSVFVADAKTRQVYRLSLASIEAPDADVDGISLAFAARDLLATNGTLWIATETALIEHVDGESDEYDFVRARAVASVDERAVSGGAIAVATGNRVENYRPEGLERVTDAAGSRLRRIQTFIAPR
jgi:PKD repeat protein